MRKSVKRGAAIAGAALLVVFIAIQFLPVKRTNRPGTGDPYATREVQWILRRACYDCHSTETRWPIWGYVAPVSWQVVDDVERARKRVNFSDWASYSTAEQRAIKLTVNYMTSTHRMPLWYYVTMHPDAKLSQADLDALAAWSRDTTPEPSRR